MGFWDLFKKRKPENSSLKNQGIKSKEDIYQMAFEKISQTPPSQRFVSGVVFDAVRNQHEPISQIVHSNNPGEVLELSKFFRMTYMAFLKNPGIFGCIPCPIKAENDTNPTQWNMEICPLENKDAAVICYMPIQNNTLAARMFGIIFGSSGDGYYYCTINKDETVASDIMRNGAGLGTKKVGDIKGSGFDLRDRFLDCMQSDYYAS